MASPCRTRSASCSPVAIGSDDKVGDDGPLLLPQTSVIIHARELRFEGEGALETTSSANTQVPEPATIESGLTRGQDGAPGLKAGDVARYLERFYADPRSGPRLILRGATRQVALDREGDFLPCRNAAGQSTKSLGKAIISRNAF